MATITVTTLTDSVADDDEVSLREAIQAANTDGSVDGSEAGSGADSIVFAAGLHGTIRLDGGDGALGTAGGTLSITDDLTIDGNGRVTITGDVNNDDTTVGTTDVTDILATAQAQLDDNVRLMDAEETLTLKGLTLTGGVATGAEEDGSGGAVKAEDDLTLDGVRVSGNSAEYTGGGVYSMWIAHIANSVIDGNVSGDSGGGVDAFAATVIASTVSGNHSDASGGGVRTAFDAHITSSTFTGNSATFSGGGVSAFTVNLTNATLSGNSAGSEGGGAEGSTVNIYNSTITGNFAGVDGGGSAAGTNNLTNAIVFGNDSPGAKDVYSAFNATFTGGNIVHGEFTIDGLSPEAVAVADVFASVVTLDPDGAGGRDPFDAGAIGDNGGPVQTIALKDSDSNPAIDASSDFAAIGHDARGFSYYDHPDVPHNGVDITDLGAYEVSNGIVVTTLLDVVDGGDGLISLREAIALANANDGADTISFDASLGAGGTIRLTHADGTLQVTDELTIDGDIDDDGKADILITGDVAGDDTTVGATDITDIFASQTAGTLADNVRIISASDVTLNGLTLTGGVTADNGGAVDGTFVTLTNTTVSGNRAGGDGGGIDAGAANLANSTVSDNSAGSNGGGLWASTANLTNATLSGNRADINGGGAYTINPVSLTNSTVSGNSASNGGGIHAGTANLTNSIVLGNDATTNDEVSGGLGMTGGNILGTDVFQGDTDVGDTSATAVFAQTVDIGGGVLAGVLADNGGPVQTIALKRDLANPALDKSDNSAPATDARGEARQDWPGIANQNGSPADLGAFELQNAAPAATNLTQAKVYLEDAASVALDNIVVSDADVGDTIIARLTLANTAAGILTTSGAATYTAATGVWTITGTVAQVNAALAAVAFVPAANFNADTSIATHVEDAQGAGPTDGTISLDAAAVNDAPVITSNGGGATAAVLVAENIKPVTTVVATDLDGPGAPAYAVAGGADAALFAIDAATGALAFIAAPDFEAPADADHDNVYEVVVAASDGSLTDTQTILVTVGDIDGVTITGTKGKDKVNATKTINGDPLPTGEEDRIDGEGGNDKLSGLGGNDAITGGGGRDVLDGGAGDDMLTGGSGRDKYIGGSGLDAFVFDTQVTPRSLFDHLSQAGIKRRVDVIVDYEKDEQIILDSDALKGLSKGPLGADQFHVGQEAEANTHRIVYDASAGLLIFDRNGSAVAGEAVIARIGKHIGHLGADDFMVI